MVTQRYRVECCRLTLPTARKFDPHWLKVDSAFRPSEVGKTRIQIVGSKRLTLKEGERKEGLEFTVGGKEGKRERREGGREEREKRSLL
ncbi:hypothetical protein L345_17636, partial [Ophiophagus hannah]